MNRPTEKQKAICKLIGNQTLYWIATNDISSPTHDGDLKDDLIKLENDKIINASESKEIALRTQALLHFIQKLKD